MERIAYTRDQIDDVTIATDIIVGFPGETEEDFQATLDVVEKSRFATAFTFQYSKRPGTPAADLPDQLPKAVVQERFERLTALQDRIAAEENRKQLGRRLEVMVTAQSGRKSEETHRLSGRSQDQRLVHFSVPEGAPAPRPGDLVTVTITEAAAFHLVADPTPEDYSLRRSRAGDAWDRSQADSCGVPAPGSGAGPKAVSLGMPSLPLRTR
jgi:tRNA-2-methylthio-N6-dimethylallyladenosine synthase